MTVSLAPPPLRPGASVRVVAPSGPVPSDAFEAGLGALASRYAVSVGAAARSRHGFLAGPDEARGADLVDAVTDPAIRAVLAARGGYGATRILDAVGERVVAALKADPKPLAGFSDVTALHALWRVAGVRSVHGTMVAGMGRRVLDDELCAVLEGARPSAWEGLEVLHPGAPGEVSGVALGGNLALVAALVGTRWALDLDGAVLFLEDVGEAPYRVDRMLTQLRSSGALRGVRAVVLGGFTDSRGGADGVVVDEVLRERLAGLGVRVLAGAPFGHGAEHRPWVQGASVTVHADGRVAHDEGLA